MDQFIDRIDKLHTAPHVAWQALCLLQDEEVEIHALVKCLEADPALATSILKLVNSSYFGIPRTVSGLHQAVTFLGMRSLRLAVLGFGLVKQLSRDAPARVLRDFWRRSLSMAVAASQLAAGNDGVRSDEGYSAGLLADIGVLLLSQADAAAYVPVCEQLVHGPQLVEHERNTYGFHHGELGARLLMRWNLPEPLVHAVAGHHTWDSRADRLVQLACAADLLADALWTPQSPWLPQTRHVLDNHFGVDLDGFITLALCCKERIAEMASLFRVELDGQIDCDAITDRARRQYMEEALEAAIDWDSMTSVARSAGALWDPGKLTVDS